MSEKICIVVPIYNVEKYLNRCLNSIINQSYRNIEIILVNDGSTDSSEKICIEYQKKDKRIKYFYKKNGGLSDARNYGIDKCTSDYICFVDSDDFISKDYVKKLYKNMKENKVEISYCSSYRFKSVSDIKHIGKNNVIVLNKIDAIKQLFLKNGKISNYITMAIYNIKLFEHVRFPVGVNFEDIATMYKLIYNANAVAISNEALYYYYINNNGITQTMKEKDILDRYNNIIDRSVFIDKKLPKLKKVCEKYIFRTSLVIIKDLIKYNGVDVVKTDCFNKIRKNIIELGIKEISIKNIFIYFFVKCNKKSMYKVLIKI